MSDSFFDSNVLLYLASGMLGRVERVQNLVDDGGNVSVQVLNEMANVSRRKFGMSWQQTSQFINRTVRLFDIWPVTVDIHKDGLRLAERYGFAIYDSFIVAAALAADCDTLWSEDMQAGMVVDGRLTIANPFQGDPSLIPAS
ncbi:PIN domain-containing protein [Tardiphaga alba]|uniref:PIN domain-containing protein n=1 Tax=Tardiphaga alba TaxID=340268 RepID=A0ABX8A5S3_9BRAD|nr:PIN domain-containing protein [Tardiphaga alba]